MTRREFLRLLALSGFSLVAPADLLIGSDGTGRKAPKRWAMVVDIFACAKKEGCTECIEACHRVHNVPDMPDAARRIKWIWTSPYHALFPEQPAYMEAFKGRRITALCNHCEDPPCVPVCPTKATFRRDDGIVMMDYHRCIGCRYCMAACPYGARSFNWQDPRPFIHAIDKGYPTRAKGVVEKCSFCDERLARGLLPACVDACKGACLVFGDLNDERSQVVRLLRSRPAIQRKPELGTRPKVFYLLA